MTILQEYTINKFGENYNRFNYYCMYNWIKTFWIQSIINLDQQISMLLRRDLLFAFQDFAKTLAVTCNFSTKVVANPIQVIIIIKIIIFYLNTWHCYFINILIVEILHVLYFYNLD